MSVEFLMQLGKLGGNKGINDPDILSRVAKIWVGPKMNEACVADGYLKNADDANLGAYDPSAPPPKQFRNPVHCVGHSNDGLVYVCDRQADRIPFFYAGGTFVKEAFFAEEKLGSGSTWILCNQKGGVCQGRRRRAAGVPPGPPGRRVLAIDLDHQANFTTPLRLSGRAAISAFMADALRTGTPPAPPDKPLELVPGDHALLGFERQPALHAPFARNFRAFPAAAGSVFDVCVIDTNPNPDFRVIAALASADHVLSPIRLKQEAMDGVSGLLNHDRVGPAQDHGCAEPEACTDRPAAADGRADAVPAVQLPAGGAAVPPADDPHRRRARSLCVDPAPVLHRRGAG